MIDAMRLMDEIMELGTTNELEKVWMEFGLDAGDRRGFMAGYLMALGTLASRCVHLRVSEADYRDALAEHANLH